jgi:hypothetical protein
VLLDVVTAKQALVMPPHDAPFAVKAPAPSPIIIV